METTETSPRSHANVADWRYVKRHIIGIKINVHGMISAQKEELVKCVRQKVEEYPNKDELDHKGDRI